MLMTDSTETTGNIGVHDKNIDIAVVPASWRSTLKKGVGMATVGVAATYAVHQAWQNRHNYYDAASKAVSNVTNDLAHSASDAASCMHHGLMDLFSSKLPSLAPPQHVQEELNATRMQTPSKAARRDDDGQLRDAEAAASLLLIPAPHVALLGPTRTTQVSIMRSTQVPTARLWLAQRKSTRSWALAITGVFQTNSSQKACSVMHVLSTSRIL